MGQNMTSRGDLCHLPCACNSPILSTEEMWTGCFFHRLRKREKESMLETHPVSAPPGRSSLLRSILSLLIITAAIPFGCYTLLKAYHASDVTALGGRGNAAASESR